MSTRQLRRRGAPPVTHETNRRLVFEKCRRCSAPDHEPEDDGQGKRFQRLDYAADVVLGDGQRQSISGPRALLHDALDLP